MKFIGKYGPNLFMIYLFSNDNYIEINIFIVEGPIVNMEEEKSKWLLQQLGPQPTFEKGANEYSNCLRRSEWIYKANSIDFQLFIDYLIKERGFKMIKDYEKCETKFLISKKRIQMVKDYG